MKYAILTEVFSQKPEKPVYHYTTQSGLLGIIKSRHIWATHTQYLNDRREFRYAMDLFEKEIESLRVGGKRRRKNVLKRMSKGLDSNPESVNVCVCSFSEKPDSLSQWQAYGGGMCGFAIGLEGDFLAALVQKNQWYLARCIYSLDEQKELVRSLIEAVIDEHQGQDSVQVAIRQIAALVFKEHDNYYVHSWGGNFIPYLLRYAPILKDPSFKEEQEWRVISRPLACTLKNFDFRQGNSVLIPYYKFPLFADGLDFRIREIIVGPTRDPELSRKSVSSLLASQELSDIPVRVSRVPFRNL